jgi:hypothetical protein
MKTHLKEWSKLLTFFILLPYIAVLLLGITLVILLFTAKAYEQSVIALAALFGYVAAPFGLVYSFYFWKAKAENLVKIAHNLKAGGVSDEVAAGVVNTQNIGGIT